MSKISLKISFSALCLLLLCPPVLLANTGVFSGAGNQIIPIKNSDIQLKNEEVDFIIEYQKDTTGKTEPPIVLVEANFELVNLSNKELKPQLGFPFLSLQGFGDEKEVLEKIDFRVESDGKPQEATLKYGLIESTFDPQGLFEKIFSWEEDFKPNQTKKIKVNYKLKMTVGVHPLSLKHPQRIFGFFFSFAYITKTAYTWKPPIDSAIFKANLAAISKRMRDPGIFKDIFVSADVANMSKPLITVEFLPQAMREGDIFTWKFKETVPDQGLSFIINILAVPITLNEAQMVLKEKSKMGKEDYLRYLEDLLEAYKFDGKYLLFPEDEKDLQEIRKLVQKELSVLKHE